MCCDDEFIAKRGRLCCVGTNITLRFLPFREVKNWGHGNCIYSILFVSYFIFSALNILGGNINMASWYPLFSQIIK